MCLTTSSEIKVADKDIVCYKVLTYISGRDIYVTPCRNYEVSKEIIEGREPLVPYIYDVEEVSNDGLNNLAEVNGGFIHSYKTIKDAAIYWEKVNILFECYIPKGTAYYDGDDGDYASKAIFFKNKVDVISLSEEKEKTVSDLLRKIPFNDDDYLDKRILEIHHYIIPEVARNIILNYDDIDLAASQLKETYAFSYKTDMELNYEICGDFRAYTFQDSIKVAKEYIKLIKYLNEFTLYEIYKNFGTKYYFGNFIEAFVNVVKIMVMLNYDTASIDYKRIYNILAKLSEIPLVTYKDLNMEFIKSLYAAYIYMGNNERIENMTKEILKNTMIFEDIINEAKNASCE